MPFAVSAVAGGVFWGSVAAGVYSADKADSANKRSIKASASAADDERALARETLDYYKSRDAQSASLQAQANAIAGKVANSQVALMDQQRQISGEYHTRNKSVFWPLENSIVKNANEFDTPARREAEAGKAVADVGLQIDGERQAMVRNQQRMGVNPSSGNSLAMNNQMSLAAASAKGSAATAARDKIETQGFARKMDAASLGRGLASAQATAASTATQAGNGAVSAAYAPVNAAAQSTQLLGNALQDYQSSMSGANRLLISAQQREADQWGSTSNALFGLAGSAAGSYFGKK
ncbi:hypothetical protein F3K02_08900 [Hydrogenophaga sp. D2P1]|uniref:Uncharacterized protein n=1 Tax=Hydrogenophaga aromaticivorans TaxID=2610898 RepID=A0A7Y8GV12_9BURK|nr:hypothetical protein [Hydrogenophaga aromaticivorans]NWF45364.1 hypothetical protein [Hydrogenophaga aromaticivorans]